MSTGPDGCDLVFLPLMTPPKHGGDLLWAKQCYPKVADWLDLSAALNPAPWPVPRIPQHCFQQLPDDYEPQVQAASEYYGVSANTQVALWPVNGSQQGIELLPHLFRKSTGQRSAIRVAVPEEGYQEHAWCWQKSGYQVYSYRATSADGLRACASQCDVLVVVNPNNPTGQLFDSKTLLSCHRELEAKGGWLVVDEAFMDAYPEDVQQGLSVSGYASDTLIVLRSIGKFFGLAGIRSGFVLSGTRVIDGLKFLTGPWPVSGVTSWLTTQMLADRAWCRAARVALNRQSDDLCMMLRDRVVDIPVGHSPWHDPEPDICQANLFVSFILPGGAEASAALQQHLAANGIWIRRYCQSGRVRIGIPGSKVLLERLEDAFQSWLNG